MEEDSVSALGNLSSLSGRALSRRRPRQPSRLLTIEYSTAWNVIVSSQPGHPHNPCRPARV
ncbi:hypothetical protein GCM10010306_028420 [Streptomyces umbrinus]|nr:hypothetical protein GCM10010306_028420 [Streptomyces umbrinus]